jgi:HD-GYP domain-containing protein (c-di-GMP phosphodiesterase class II)
VEKTPKPNIPEKSPLRAAAQENAEAYRNYVNLIKQLDEVFAHIGANTPVERGTIDTIANTLIRVIQERRKQFVGYILGSKIAGHDLAKGSVNTAILSAFIAMELKLANSRIIQVVTGALLRDAGMLRLPRYITNTREGLSETESQALQTHSRYSYKIICTELHYPEDVGVIALQHHERWDGGGYPQKRSLTAIAPGARIVAVADAFETLVSGQPARNATAGYQALKRLMADKGFDPAVLKAFMYAMGKPREPRQ